MYGENLDGPSMGGHSSMHNSSFASDYGLPPHGSSYPRRGTQQRLLNTYSPRISSPALPAMHAMLAPEGTSHSRSASPHMSQFNILPQSQVEVYTGSYPESELDTLESAGGTAPPNMSRFNLRSFTPIHNFPGGSTTSHRTVC